METYIQKQHPTEADGPLLKSYHNSFNKGKAENEITTKRTEEIEEQRPKAKGANALQFYSGLLKNRQALGTTTEKTGVYI